MPLVDLDDPEELRARWTALAAVAHATGFDRRWYADENGWYHQDETGSDLRMVKLGGGRAVLFGFHTQHSRTAEADLLAGSPDWIGQPEVKRRIAAGQLGFVYGSFNGTWARASYPGDPWQPLDDGFLPIAEWVTSDEEAARELIEWTAEWADYLGGLDELLPIGIRLIRTAGSTGLTPHALQELFDRLGVGPRSPQQPDLRAALVAAEHFNGPAADPVIGTAGPAAAPSAAVPPVAVVPAGPPAAAETQAEPRFEPDEGRYEPDAGRYEPDAARSVPDGGRYEADAGRYGADPGRYEADAAGYEADDDEEDEELFVVPPGISPFTGQPIGDDANLVLGGAEPFAPEPLTPELPFRPDSPFAPEPQYTPEPTYEPTRPAPAQSQYGAEAPAPRGDDYGVTGRKRRFRRKKRDEDDGEALVRLGLVGPEPETAEPRPQPPAEPPRSHPTAYAQSTPAPLGPLPSSEPPRVGGEGEGEDFYASLFADAPAAATYTPDVRRDAPRDWNAREQSPQPDQHSQSEPSAWSAADDATSEFTPFTDDTAATPIVEDDIAPPAATDDGPPAATPIVEDDIGVVDPVPADEAEYIPDHLDYDGPTDAFDVLPDSEGDRPDHDGPTDAFDVLPDSGDDRPDYDGPTDAFDVLPDSGDDEQVAASQQVSDEQPVQQPRRGQQPPAEREWVGGAWINGEWVEDVAAYLAAQQQAAQQQAAQQQAEEPPTEEHLVIVPTDAAPSADESSAGEAASSDESVENSTEDAPTAEIAAVLYADLDSGDPAEDEYYPSGPSPFATADGPTSRDLPPNGFSSITPEELKPGEYAYELDGQLFHDEILGDADWTADQLADLPPPTTAPAPGPTPTPPASSPTPTAPAPGPTPTSPAAQDPASTAPAPVAPAEAIDDPARTNAPYAADAPSTPDHQADASGAAQGAAEGQSQAPLRDVEEPFNLDDLRPMTGYNAEQLAALRSLAAPVQIGPRPFHEPGRTEQPDQQPPVAPEAPAPEAVASEATTPEAVAPEAVAPRDQADGGWGEQSAVEITAQLEPIQDDSSDLAADDSGEPEAGREQLDREQFDRGQLDREQLDREQPDARQPDAVHDAGLGSEEAGPLWQRSALDDTMERQPFGPIEDFAPGADDRPTGEAGVQVEAWQQEVSAQRGPEAGADPAWAVDPEQAPEVDSAWVVDPEQPAQADSVWAGNPEQMPEAEAGSAWAETPGQAAEAEAGSAWAAKPKGGAVSDLHRAQREVVPDLHQAQREVVPDPEQAAFEAGRGPEFGVAGASEVEVEGVPERAEAAGRREELVAPPASSAVDIPGLGVVGGEAAEVEAEPGSIEEAMRAEYERPRPRPKESEALKALREWCRVRTKIVPSGFTIQVQVLDPAAPSYRFDLEPPDVDDPQYGAERLSGLLGELWLAESQREQGGWLFARVDAAGRTVRIDRWYDQVPDWWDNPVEPRLDVLGLVRRLNDRGPDWQPSYLEKLYTTAR
ncbi:hypothetical protein [Kribbella sp. VKM Ac-2568]|uniref:hypothetical protein n=1 Tax=Kribbella sp. VKM Ac-2568 TaxID=2512219 RepID=UPI0010450979|nr:hypothetical protein [Kribbella sp. VKM Ac-2568]TCM49992.1 hypothetical protein EV648_10232 [Kribbella sp. VKM Ac-2568]